jgi:hypothetical protein
LGLLGLGLLRLLQLRFLNLRLLRRLRQGVRMDQRQYE